jgi:hypothetical protein
VAQNISQGKTDLIIKKLVDGNEIYYSLIGGKT